MPWQDRITSTPDVLNGKPRLTGTRIPVSLILGYLADGATVEGIQREFPDIESTTHNRVSLMHGENNERLGLNDFFERFGLRVALQVLVNSSILVVMLAFDNNKSTLIFKALYFLLAAPTVWVISRPIASLIYKKPGISISVNLALFISGVIMAILSFAIIVLLSKMGMLPISL